MEDHKSYQVKRQKITNSTVDKIYKSPSERALDHFIVSSINPDNNWYWKERNNPLSSKGN